jgi:hypothetical protein
MTHPAHHSLDAPPPRVTAEEIRRLAAAELSLPARLGYVALLLAALAVSVAVGSLWLTERALPLRTHVSFALIVGVGLAWVAYAGWVLTRRRVLLAGHRIVAARMAIAFCALFVGGALAVGNWGPGTRAPYAAAMQGLVLLAIAVALHVRARRRFARLLERRRALEEQAGMSAG